MKRNDMFTPGLYSTQNTANFAAVWFGMFVALKQTGGSELDSQPSWLVALPVASQAVMI